MEKDVKKIIILKEFNLIDASLIEDKIKDVKGILDCKISEKNNQTILSYIIDDWSSDYDILVLIMNTLLDEFKLDSEPFFEENEFLVYNEENEDNLKEENSLDISKEDSVKTEDEDEEHGELSKSKIFEIGISAIVFIIGLILSAIPSTSEYSKYVQIIAFSICGYEVLFEGLFGIFKGKIFSINLLMTLASVSAIILGYASEAVGIMLFYQIGEAFEITATKNVNKVVSNLKELTPNEATVENSDGKEITKKVKNIKVGEVIIVKSGQRIPLDGVIVSGSSSIDTKTITGESVYKDLTVNDEVLSGYICINGSIKVKVVSDLENSTISKITKIVENSALKNTKKEKFLNKFAKIYTPAILFSAILLAFVPPFFADSYRVALNEWLLRAIMLLCVSCPCSILLSIPLAYFCGVGNCASKGILIKSTSALEKLGNCKTVVFDKTGTLTSGELKISKIISTKKFSGKVLDFCAIAEKKSNHPIAKAILNNYDKNIDECVDFVEYAGKGVSCLYEGKKLIAGNYSFIKENGIKVNKIEEIGVKIYVAYGEELVGVIILLDKPKNEAYGTILELFDFGVKDTIMLTGDNKEYATYIRKELKMNKSVSELLPDGKVSEMQRIIDENNGKCVAYVGDGINDAPVLMSADVGFSMGTLGSDLAVESSDVVITDDNLSKIPYTLKIAKRTKKIVWQNMILSLGIKFAVISLGVFGLTTSLWYSVVADVGVLLLTVFNAFRNRLKLT